MNQRERIDQIAGQLGTAIANREYSTARDIVAALADALEAIRLPAPVFVTVPWSDVHTGDTVYDDNDVAWEVITGYGEGCGNNVEIASAELGETFNFPPEPGDTVKVVRGVIGLAADALKASGLDVAVAE